MVIPGGCGPPASSPSGFWKTCVQAVPLQRRIFVMLQIHTYAKCSTCRKAVAYLQARGLAPKVIPIREQPPSPAELKTMLRHLGGDRRKLFNTSGLDYRQLKLKDKLPTLNEAEVIALLSKNGNLVKRPFLLTDAGGAVGFRQEEWEQLLRRKA